MQPDVRLTVLATCLALAACGGDAETAESGGSAGGTAAGAGGTGGTTAAGGAGGTTGGAGGTTTGGAGGAGGAGGVTSGTGGAGGTTGLGGTTALGGAAGVGAGGAAGDAGKDAAIKDAGGTCQTDTDCLPTEKCSGAINCPDGAMCILPSRPGTCILKTPVACSTAKDCATGEVCVQTIFAIMPQPGYDAGSSDAGLPKLGVCRPAKQAARDPSPPIDRDRWWGAVESAMRGS
jgi:hypothetical protein